MRLRLLLSAAIMIAAPAADAATYIWTGPGPTYTDAGNWTPGGVPGTGDIAEFKANAAPTTITGVGGAAFSSGPSVGTLQFDSGAPAYTLTMDGGFTGFTLDGVGVVDNAANKPTILMTGGFLSLNFINAATAANANITTDVTGFLDSVNFSNTSTAGTAHITLNGFSNLNFSNTATAGSALIDALGNAVNFNAGSSAGSATINVSSPSGIGTVNFNTTSTAANAVINANDSPVNVNNNATLGAASVNLSGTGAAGGGGSLSFSNNGDGGTGKVTMNSDPDNFVDFSGSLGPAGNSKLGIGSISGGLNGFVYVGGNTVSIGTNNLSTTLNAVIADCFGDCGAVGAALPLSGGGINKVGSGNLILTAVSTLTGPVTVSGGTLSVNGSLAASSKVTVASGGTLGGTGTLSATTVQSGGTLAPGNSIGTIHVAGNLVFNAGSTYHVEIAPAANDKTLVSGTASLGGTVQADFAGGTYIGGTQYTLVTSTGALSGTFASLSTLNLPAGFTASLTYDANDAYLKLLGGNAQDGLIHATLVSAYLEDERLIRDAVLDHLLTAGDGIRIWGEGFTAYGTIGASNVMGHNHSGFIAGVDMPIGDGFTAGAAGAWTDYKVTMPSKTSSAKGDAGHALAYLGWNDLGDNGSGWMMKAGGEYGWGSAQIHRTVSSTGETDTNHESANTAQIFGEAAFRDHFLGADLEPHADVFWVMAQNGAFAETGGAQAMSGTAITQNASFARLGVRGLGRWIDLGGGVEIAPSLDIGWQVALSHPTPGVTVGFATGTPTLLAGTPGAVNAGTAQLGLAAKFGDNADLHLGYDGIFSSSESDHGITARLEIRL